MAEQTSRGGGIEASEGGLAVDSAQDGAPAAPPERMGMDRDTGVEGYAETPQGLEHDAQRLLDDDTPAAPASPYAEPASAEVIRALDEKQVGDAYAGGPMTYVDDPAAERSESQRSFRGPDEGRSMHDGEPGHAQRARPAQSAQSSGRRGDWAGAALLAGAVALTAGGIALAASARRRDGERSPNDAPEHAKKRRGDVIGFTLAINASREELYTRWRDQRILVRTMENVRSIKPVAGDPTRSEWTMRGPFGADVSFISHITVDEPNQRIAWEAEGNPFAAHNGEVTFTTAPQGHGTYVRVTTTVPFGAAGRLGAAATGMDPKGSLRRDLKRLKQVMETGELATNGEGN